MTYGCLLRPHREIRELTWSDFSEDLKLFIYQEIEINLEEIELFLYHLILEILLVKGEPHHNIFSIKPQPLNQDYFKTLWSRFKKTI